jgi:LPS export ABC transporter permease LptG
MKIFDKYIIKELFPFTLAGLSFITFIILINNIVQLAGFLIRNTVSFMVFLKVVVNLLPAAAIFGVPMAILFGTIIGIGRLSADSEITAFRACGISLSRFIKPTLIFALLAMIADLTISLYWLPHSNQQLSVLYRRIITSRTLTSQIKPRVFIEDIPEKVLYVSRLTNRDRVWEDVILFDTTRAYEPSMIFAKRAIPYDEDFGKGINLKLSEVYIYNVDLKDPVHRSRVTFSKEMVLKLLEKRQFEDAEMIFEKSDRAQTIEELKESIKKTSIDNYAELEFTNDTNDLRKIYVTLIIDTTRDSDAAKTEYPYNFALQPLASQSFTMTFTLPRFKEFKGIGLKISSAERGGQRIIYNGYENADAINQKYFGNKLEISLEDARNQRLLFKDAAGNDEVTINRIKIDSFRFRRDYERFVVEIHKKYAIPFSCIIFGLLGLPLGISARKAGRSFGYLVSIMIFVSYWYMLLNGEMLADTGKISPFIGAWGADIFFFFIAGWFLLRMRKEKDFQLIERSAAMLYSVRGAIARAARNGSRAVQSVFLRMFGKTASKSRGRKVSVKSPGAERASRPREGLKQQASPKLIIQVKRMYMRFPNLIDRYILLSFIRLFLLILLVLYAISVIVQFTEINDDIHKNNVSYSILWNYYKYRLPDTLLLLIPISSLVATLATFGIMTRNNETVAVKAAGISQYRMAVPVLAIALLLSVVTFNISEKVLPQSKVKYDEVKRKIKNLKPQTLEQMGRQFLFGKAQISNLNRIYYFYQYDESDYRFSKISFYDYDPATMKLMQRLSAESAYWDEEFQGWTFQNGWVQKFTYPGIMTEEFENRIYQLDETPEYFKRAWQTPDQMSYGELRKLIAELKMKGFDPVYEQVRLSWKLAYAIVTFVVVIVGIPFSFRLDNRGSLSGIFISLVIVLVYYPMTNVLKHLGYSGVLPPLLAAWGGNLLFIFLSLFLIFKMRT